MWMVKFIRHYEKQGWREPGPKSSRNEEEYLGVREGDPKMVSTIFLLHITLFWSFLKTHHQSQSHTDFSSRNFIVLHFTGSKTFRTVYFIFFSCTPLGRLCSTVEQESWARTFLALLPGLRGSVQSLTIKDEVNCRVFVDVPYQAEDVPLYS